ncbi:MAG: nucleoside-diphosphate kinase [Chloroflexi bacterium]|nr:nucleoside-diphosphate kinase [Chloroflexota bacterium]MCL5075904.1 nucleoside-diphosphate kinase [Chloroflexota bacterium]
MERTLVIIKPDGVQRGLIGPILGRFEQRGLRIVALKMMSIDRALAERHYAVHRGKFFFENLVDYISSSPIVGAIVEGPQAVQVVRTMVGATRPHEAMPGTIRGDYAVAGLRNLIHASDSIETAQEEIALFFAEEEIVSYTRDIDKWIYE